MATLDRSTLPRTRRARPRASPLSRWWRRRPVRRALVVTHRWSALVLGLLLVIETTAGSILLYEGDIGRILHRSLFTATASASPLNAEQALEVVQEAHPPFGATWASPDHGVWFVGNPDYGMYYAIDSGTGDINGTYERQHGVLAFVVNLHDCALTCEGYPGTVSWLSAQVPDLGLAFLADATWGSVILTFLGLLMLLLAVTGAITWWPGLRKLRHRTRVRTDKGRFARDFDLHNLIGIIAVPFILMWGLTGTSFELPAVKDAWLTVTGGVASDPDEYSFTAHQAPKGTPQISLKEATAAAEATVPGAHNRVSQVTIPTTDAPYYEIDIVSAYRSYSHEAIYQGDNYVYVDAHDAGHTKVADGTAGKPLTNILYDKIIEPSHFGWNVNGWWRLIWLAMGLSPLALMITGISTWQARGATNRKKARAKAARAAAASGAGA